jgi:hypothetical protein
MKPNVNEVWDLINQLTPEERKIIYNKLNEDIKLKLNYILDNVSSRAEKDNFDIKTITDEVEEIRGKNHEKN